MALSNTFVFDLSNKRTKNWQKKSAAVNTEKTDIPSALNASTRNLTKGDSLIV
jgi:hypothetical protein